MRKLVLPGTMAVGESPILDSQTTRYLLKVLRMARGETFMATDEAGNEFICELVGVSKEGAELVLRAQPQPETGPRTLRIGLVQALPKGPKMDLILRQAVEAGVSAVFPLQTRNCVAREHDEADRDDKLERRRKIVREALQQSGSTVLTKVLPLSTPETLLALLSSEGFPEERSLYLICHELQLSGKSLHEYCAGEERPVVLLIGPEGGFDPEETRAFQAMGFRPIHFEGAILRTETAAIYAIAAVKTIIMERGSWKLSN